MTTVPSPKLRTAPEPRILHRLIGPEPGPTVIRVVALHGNEHAGIEAVHRVAHQVLALESGEWIAGLPDGGALKVMHLLGYRREDDRGRWLRVRRRKHDPL